MAGPAGIGPGRLSDASRAPRVGPTASPPEISAIVPSYNHGPYVVEALESVLAQELQPLEVVVIDDGSSDGSPQLLEPYRDRVRLELRENHGISATFSRGLELAQGRYVAYCCSDDRWHPQHLLRAWTKLGETPEARVSFGSARVIGVQGEPRPESLFAPLSKSNPLGQLLQEGNSLCFSAAVFSRQAALEAGAFDEALGLLQDYELWLKLLLQGPAASVEEVTVDFRWTGENASGPAARPQRYHDLVKILASLGESLPPESGLHLPLRTQLRRAHLRLARISPSHRSHHLEQAHVYGAARTRCLWERWIGRFLTQG